MKTERIYVQLLDEGTEVFRPVDAEKVKENVYKISEFQEYNPVTEVWEFLPGQTVEVEERKNTVEKNDRTLKVAVKLHS